jgi:4-alpha-glucanotransferase
VSAVKVPLLKKAADRLLSADQFKQLRDEMTAWRKAHSWIEDSAIFEVARGQPDLADKAWWDWPEGLRFRQAKEMNAFRWAWNGTCCTARKAGFNKKMGVLHVVCREEHKQAIEQWVATQFLFDRQWRALKVGWP